MPNIKIHVHEVNLFIDHKYIVCIVVYTSKYYNFKANYFTCCRHYTYRDVYEKKLLLSPNLAVTCITIVYRN